MSSINNQLSISTENVLLLESRAEHARSDWPSVRIARGVSLNDETDVCCWGDFQNVLGRENYGKGNAYALGSIALTYVDATELGKMLNAKYPKAYQDRSKTKQLVTRFQKDYNQFVKYKSRQLVESQTDSLIYEKIGADISLESDNIDSRTWGIASVAVSSQIKAFGSKRIGMRIDEEFIDKEMQFTIEYLKDSKLDVKFIDPDRSPHISLFESYEPVVSAGLRVPTDRLDTITLDYPMAITS